jgi:hypothetical protein
MKDNFPSLNSLPADKFPLFSYFGYIKDQILNIMTNKFLKSGDEHALETSVLLDLNTLYKIISSQNT